jgi:cytochrome c553
MKNVARSPISRFARASVLAVAIGAGAAQAQAPAVVAKGDPLAGKLKATAICSGCHGVPGIRAAFPEVYNVPKLGGQNEGYLLVALKAYKAGDRFNQTMRAQASALSDQEMADIAAYYAQANPLTASK